MKIYVQHLTRLSAAQLSANEGDYVIEQDQILKDEIIEEEILSQLNQFPGRSQEEMTLESEFLKNIFFLKHNPLEIRSLPSAPLSISFEDAKNYLSYITKNRKQIDCYNIPGRADNSNSEKSPFYNAIQKQ